MEETLIKKPTPNEGQQESIDFLIEWFNRKDWDNLDCIRASLSGAAGTGKTFSVKYFIEFLIENRLLNGANVVVSAPTHKAKKVIAAATGFTAMTAQALLGLRPNTDLDEFDVNNPIFAPTEEEKIQNFKLLILDEASMLNTDAYNMFIKSCKEFKVKLLCVGDINQIPPVKEAVSPAMSISNITCLKVIVRQDHDNPLTELVKVAVDDVMNGTDNIIEFCSTPKMVSNELGGYQVINDNKSFGRLMMHYFERIKDDNLYAKYLAFTNENVTLTNKGIRSYLFNNTEDCVSLNDVLMGYDSITIEHKAFGGGKEYESILTNSEDYIVVNCSKISVDDYGIKGFHVELKNLDSDSPNSKTFIVDSSDINNVIKFRDNIDQLLLNAKRFKGQFWAKYYAFKNRRILIKPLFADVNGKQTLILKKNIDYAYGLTVHKSQGSTYKNVFVNLRNLMQVYDPQLRRRLIYVAISRTKENCFVFL